jgi:N-acetylglucosamine kinase-like BadF-type ATPase
MEYFIGTDLGGTKTHTIIADGAGNVVGFGAGPGGNHQSVGYERMFVALSTAATEALVSASLDSKSIARAAYGIAGYDWHSELPRTSAVIDRLGLSGPYNVVNDAIPGLVAGADDGWGVVLVSGTGCNCRGWSRDRQREGRATGYGILMGEFAGASELVYKAMQFVGFSWTQRFPPTRLTDIFVKYTGAKDADDLIEGYTEHTYHVGADAAPQIFQAAEEGDEVALRLIRWAGCELGEMANAVIRQLSLEKEKFQVVLSGSMFEGGKLLTDPLRETIQRVAPGATLKRLTVPPVIGSVLIAMLDAGIAPTPEIRQRLAATLKAHENYRENGA